jgi:hypothetical protein
MRGQFWTPIDRYASRTNPALRFQSNVLALPIRNPVKMEGDEHHALRIVRIMKDAGTAAGEIMMFGAIEAVWLKPDDATHEELLAGLRYAADQGWIEDAGTAVRLTAQGAMI